MFLLFAFGAAIALCALLWRVAVYALPVFVAFSIGFGLLSAGAGVTAVVVGLIAGVMSWTLARWAFSRSNNPVKFILIALFVLAAAIMGFEIVWQIGETASLAWRIILGGAAAIAAGGTCLLRLSEDHSSDPADRLS